MALSTLKFQYLNVNECPKRSWKYLKIEYVKWANVTLPRSQVVETTLAENIPGYVE
jgi:hypothetical protein